MQSETLKKQFQNPGAEYSMIPFWFLNDRLDHDKLTAQMDDFLAKGINGFVIHPRMGLPDDYDYLGSEYFEDVRFLTEQASRRQMKVVLYDEGMYPSGSAHGLVVKANPKFAARGLRKAVFSAAKPVCLKDILQKGERVECAFACEGSACGPALSAPVHLLEENGSSYTAPDQNGSIILLISTYSHGTIRGIHFGEDDNEPGAPAAADLLNPDAVKKFIEITYDRYAQELGDYFGSTIFAMFTDEPSLLGRCVDSKEIKPWTTDFLSYYKSLGGAWEDLLALWYDIGPETGLKRARFEEALSRRLEQTYYRQLSEWCGAHGIALTGHPAQSFDFGTERYFQIPGQDIVWRCVEPGGERGVEGPDSTLGKCSSDAARHFGRRRNANECFGCCGPKGHQWEFSADDLKWYMDWLFARGVNLLYPHAFLYSTNGDARLNERAPDVGPNNLWWEYFGIFSAYVKRMCWLNTDSFNTAPVAVLCGKSCMPWRAAKSMLQNQIEFNYLEQSLLAEKCTLRHGLICIEKQSYSAVVVEDPEILSPETHAFLKSFAESGGCLVACGQKNGLLPDETVWINKPEQAAKTLSPRITADIVTKNCPGLRASHLIKDGNDFFLFVNEGEDAIEQNVALRATGGLETWDAMTGTISPVSVSYRDGGYLHFHLSLPRRGSIVIHAGKEIHHIPEKEKLSLTDTIPVSSNFTLRFENDETITLSELQSWTALKKREHYSGKGVYETRCGIEIPEDARKVLLDLGNVKEIAELWVNGKRVGVRLWAPYQFDITRQAGSRIDRIRVAVTNSIANRISGASLDSGLLGPVTIRVYR